MQSVYPKATGHLALIFFLVISLGSCSHKYDSNTLDLAFYQWNKWHDREAETGNAGDYHAPAGGWDVFNRGVGELVRIPSAVQDSGGVAWYHCRFTLPEEWEGSRISLIFEGINPLADIYLNDILVGTVPLSADPAEIDVSEPVNYTLDNHLSVRVIWQPGNASESGWGVTGGISVKSGPETQNNMK